MSLLVYSASAGSGKTYTLALKYISLALMSEMPNAFSTILAVTFTNKAATEMKDRILGQLFNLSHGGLDKGFLNDVIRETKLTEDVVCQRASKTLNAIIHDYDHFRVETIDSFFQSLLTNMAHELKLSRGFRVDLDDTLVISQAIDRMLLTLNKHGNKAIIDMVMDYMDRHINDDQGWNIARDLKTFAQKNLFCDDYTNNEKEINQLTGNQERILSFNNALRSYIKTADNEVSHIVNEIKDVINTWEGEQTKNLGYIKTFITDVSTLGLYKAKDKVSVTKVAADAKALFLKKDKPTDKQIASAQLLSPLLAQLLKIREDESQKSAYNSCKLILKNLDTLALLGVIAHEVTNLTSEEGTFLLARTPELFSRLIKGSDASFVFEKAGTTFRHIMIDEFQDTSRMQWNNFKTLLFENQAKGDESMLVGDIKQSIYRWRGGDWNILFTIKTEMPEAKVEPKVDNFRSLPIVVRFNNAFFTKAATLIDGKEWTPPTNWLQQTKRMMPFVSQEDATDDTLIERIYQDVEQTPRNSKGCGYVRVETLDPNTTKEEITQLLHDNITKLHTEQGIPYNEMLILVRRNEDAAYIVSQMSKLNDSLNLTSEQAYFYTSSAMVMCIIYTLKFVENAQDTVSLKLFEENYKSLFSLLSDADLTKHFNDNKDAFITSINDEATIKKWHHTPLYELIQEIAQRLQFQYIEQLCHCEQSAYLFDFFDEVLSFQNDNIANITTFLTHWEEKLFKKTINTSSTDAIQVMTIHKAKGLEAHTVFIPFANFSTEKDWGDSTIWCSVANNTDSELSTLFAKLPTLPISNANAKTIQSSIFASHYETEHLQMRIDALNTLYVAFTRARNNLFVWSTSPKKSHKQNIYFWIDAFVNNLQPSHEYTKQKGGQSSTPTIVTYGELELYTPKPQHTQLNPFEKPQESCTNIAFKEGGLSAVSFLQSGKADEFIADTESQIMGITEEYKQKLKQREYINQGLLYHALFSRINTYADVDTAVNSLLREGVISTKQQANEMQKLIVKVLHQPKVKSWFDGSYQLFNECNILYRNDAGLAVTQRPDRVMVADEEAIVIDYKFGGEKRAYNSQVRNYMNHLSQLINKPVKGYLWYVFENKIEEVE